jgi:hypothetical protein
LFLAWLGFLGFLVYERNSIVLASPQFAVAQAIVIAEMREGDSTVAVKEVAWCARKEDRKRLENKLVLPELLSCGKTQPGSYIIPLSDAEGFFEIAPITSTGSYTHAGLLIQSGGPYPEAVLARILRYAKENPRRAEGFAEPAVAPLVHCFAQRVMWPGVPADVPIRNLQFPRRLPIADARALRDDLIKLQAKVQLMNVAELRIYPDTSATRRQLANIVAQKHP